MTRSALPARGRPRGRPRAGTAGDRREQILAAATDEFAELGYDAASMRSIARRSDVDPALVHHYFDSKADLFTAAIGAPIRPDQMIAQIMAGPREEIGRRIVRYLLTTLDEPDTGKSAVALLRAALGNKAMTPLLAQFLSREVFARIARELGTPDAELRANLLAPQVVGVLITRYVLKLEPIAQASPDELVARIAPVLQFHLVGYPNPGPIVP